LSFIDNSLSNEGSPVLLSLPPLPASWLGVSLPLLGFFEPLLHPTSNDAMMQITRMMDSTNLSFFILDPPFNSLMIILLILPKGGLTRLLKKVKIRML